MFLGSSPLGASTRELATFLGVRADTALDYIQRLHKEGRVSRVCTGCHTKWTSAANAEAARAAWEKHLARSKPKKPKVVKLRITQKPVLVDRSTQRVVPAAVAPRPQILGPISVFDVR